jgi:hypothetical protein
MSRDSGFIIEAPYTYAAMVVPPRCRNAREVAVLDRVPLRVRAVDAGDFPVAVAMETGMFPERIDLRWDGRRLWRPDGAAPPGVGQDWLQERLDAFDPDFLGGHQEPVAGAVPRAALEGHVESDNRRDRVADMLAAAAGVLVSEGRLHRASMEPIWQVRGNWIEATLAPESLADPVQASRMSPHSVADMFRADRRAAAEAAVAAVHGRCVTRGEIEVLVPDAIRLRLGDAGLLASVWRDILEDEGTRLGAYSVERFALWAAVRDAVPRSGPVDGEFVRAVIDFVSQGAAEHDCANVRRALAAMRAEREHIAARAAPAEEPPAPRRT